jgi:hypothetical protein
VTDTLHHYVRARTSDDLQYLRSGLFDELIINANLLENSPDSAETHLRKQRLRYMVDPVLWRFQVPEWWRNDKGETKRNYVKLAKAYSEGTDIRMASGPLMQTVPSTTDWQRLTANIVKYQRHRLAAITQLDMLDPVFSAELRPTRVIAPALVAFSQSEDEINRLLIEAATDAAAEPVAAVVVIPDTRLNRRTTEGLLGTIPTDGVGAYFLWTPGVTEDLVLSDHETVAALAMTLSAFRARGIPSVHLHGRYTGMALAQLGISGIAHHLGWVDNGDPATEPGGFARSCQTYVPGIRAAMRFPQAEAVGGHLSPDDYINLYCGCDFCRGAFEAETHPFDLLLEDQLLANVHRRTPTARAISANVWHYLLARGQEIDAFRSRPVEDVIQQDLARAAALAGAGQASRLERLAQELRGA